MNSPTATDGRLPIEPLRKITERIREISGLKADVCIFDAHGKNPVLRIQKTMPEGIAVVIVLLPDSPEKLHEKCGDEFIRFLIYGAESQFRSLAQRN